MRVNDNVRPWVLLESNSLAVALCRWVSEVERCLGAITRRSRETHWTNSSRGMVAVHLSKNSTRNGPAR